MCLEPSPKCQSAVSSSAGDCCGPRARSVFDSTSSLGRLALRCALRCRGALAFHFCARSCAAAHISSSTVNDWKKKLLPDTGVCHHTKAARHGGVSSHGSCPTWGCAITRERRDDTRLKSILCGPDIRWRPRTVQQLSSCQCGVRLPTACPLPPGLPMSCPPSSFSTQSVYLPGRLLPIPAPASAKLLQ